MSQGAARCLVWPIAQDDANSLWQNGISGYPQKLWITLWGIVWDVLLTLCLKRVLCVAPIFWMIKYPLIIMWLYYWMGLLQRCQAVHFPFLAVRDLPTLSVHKVVGYCVG